jgi:hypothetical protein
MYGRICHKHVGWLTLLSETPEQIQRLAEQVYLLGMSRQNPLKQYEMSMLEDI